MPVDIDIDDTSVTAYISGDVDHHSAGELREKIDRAVEMSYPEVLILDFGGVTFMDRSGIGLVLGRWQLMRDISGEAVVQTAAKYISKVMRMAGIEKLLSDQDKKEESLV